MQTAMTRGMKLQGYMQRHKKKTTQNVCITVIESKKTVFWFTEKNFKRKEELRDATYANCFQEQLATALKTTHALQYVLANSIQTKLKHFPGVASHKTQTTNFPAVSSFITYRRCKHPPAWWFSLTTYLVTGPIWPPGENPYTTVWRQVQLDWDHLGRQSNASHGNKICNKCLRLSYRHHTLEKCGGHVTV